MRPTHVAVPGGSLAVEQSPGSGEPVLAVHGLSSTRRLWDWLRAEAPDLPLVAPDLRGRGDSVDVSGPSGLARHAADCVAVLDALGLERVHVVGMSMGGYIAVQLAVLHPERVRSLVLVDGGPPMDPPPGLTRELLPVAFRDRLARLDRQFASVEEYAALFTSATAPLLDPADPVLHGYLAHDLDAQGRVRLSDDVVVTDAEDVFFGAGLGGWDALDPALPVRWTHAEWASGPGTPPAYGPDAVARYTHRCAAVRALPGLDHAASIMTKAGAVATAELLEQARA